VPFLVVTLVAGARRGLAAWPAALATGVAFALAQGLAAALVGPQLADLAGALAALAALLVLLRLWRPRAVHRFEHDPPPPPAAPPPLGRVLRAFSPFALLALAVTAWSLPPARALLDAATVVVPIPGLEAAAGAPGPGAAIRLDLLAASGTAVLAAALASAIALGATRAELQRVLARTATSVRGPVATVALVLAFASVVNGAGMAAELGRAVAAAGPLFPAVSPLLGWLGVVLTGSNTASNALFAPLQAATAATVAMPPLLAVASNVVGGATAQMVTPASIAVATAGVPGVHGREGDVLRLTLGRSLALASAVCLLVWAEARPLAGWLPRPAPARDAAAPPSRLDGALLLSAAAAAAGAIALGARRAGRAPGGPERRASAPSENA
jgi:lactate permease